MLRLVPTNGFIKRKLKLNNNPTSQYGFHHPGLTFPEDKNKFAGKFCSEVEVKTGSTENWEADCLSLCSKNEHSVIYSKRFMSIFCKTYFIFPEC